MRRLEAVSSAGRQPVLAENVHASDKRATAVDDQSFV
jgi:hypothetical protein